MNKNAQAEAPAQRKDSMETHPSTYIDGDVPKGKDHVGTCHFSDLAPVSPILEARIPHYVLDPKVPLSTVAALATRTAPVLSCPNQKRCDKHQQLPPELQHAKAIQPPMPQLKNTRQSRTEDLVASGNAKRQASSNLERCGHLQAVARAHEDARRTTKHKSNVATAPIRSRLSDEELQSRADERWCRDVCGPNEKNFVNAAMSVLYNADIIAKSQCILTDDGWHFKFKNPAVGETCLAYAKAAYEHIHILHIHALHNLHQNIRAEPRWILNPRLLPGNPWVLAVDVPDFLTAKIDPPQRKQWDALAPPASFCNPRTVLTHLLTLKSSEENIGALSLFYPAVAKLGVLGWRAVERVVKCPKEKLEVLYMALDAILRVDPKDWLAPPSMRHNWCRECEMGLARIAIDWSRTMTMPTMVEVAFDRLERILTHAEAMVTADSGLLNGRSVPAAAPVRANTDATSARESASSQSSNVIASSTRAERMPASKETAGRSTPPATTSSQSSNDIASSTFAEIGDSCISLGIGEVEELSPRNAALDIAPEFIEIAPDVMIRAPRREQYENPAMDFVEVAPGLRLPKQCFTQRDPARGPVIDYLDLGLENTVPDPTKVGKEERAVHKEEKIVDDEENAVDDSEGDLSDEEESLYGQVKIVRRESLLGAQE